MIPNNKLSTQVDAGRIIAPYNKNVGWPAAFDYGGVAPGDVSQGKVFQLWSLTHQGNDFILTPLTSGSPITLFSRPGTVTELSFTFDQNLNPVVAFFENGESYYRWYDAALPGYVVTQLPAGSKYPRVILDHPTETATTSDVLLIYVRNDTLYYRQQRDKYVTEYTLKNNVRRLTRVGKNSKNRIQFEFF